MGDGLIFLSSWRVYCFFFFVFFFYFPEFGGGGRVIFNDVTWLFLGHFYCERRKYTCARPSVVISHNVTSVTGDELRHVRFVCVMGSLSRFMWFVMLFRSFTSNVICLARIRLNSCVLGEQNVNTMWSLTASMTYTVPANWLYLDNCNSEPAKRLNSWKVNRLRVSRYTAVYGGEYPPSARAVRLIRLMSAVELWQNTKSIITTTTF